MFLAAINAPDSKKLEVVADGLTLWHGVQLAIDTTLVSPLRRDETAKRRAANHDGAALEEAKQRKQRTYQKLSGDGGQGWSYWLQKWVADGVPRQRSSRAHLPTSGHKTEPLLLQGRPQAVWLRRWSAMLACSGGTGTATGVPSVQEVMREDDRFAGPERGGQLGCWFHVTFHREARCTCVLFCSGRFQQRFSFFRVRKKKKRRGLQQKRRCNHDRTRSNS